MGRSAPLSLEMRNARLKYRIPGAAVGLVASLLPLYAQGDIQPAVRAFLQAWYVDKKSPDELKSFVAKDNGFNLIPAATSSKAPLTAARADPVRALFAGAFVSPRVGMRFEPPKTLSDAIEFPPAKAPGARTMSVRGAIVSSEFAIYTPEALPKGGFLPVRKPSGDDPVANYLYHLTQAYKGKLYIAIYSAKGGGMRQETAVTYWIPENGVWKLAAFMGTNW
jgi:hypothetical protein